MTAKDLANDLSMSGKFFTDLEKSLETLLKLSQGIYLKMMGKLVEFGKDSVDFQRACNEFLVKTELTEDAWDHSVGDAGKTVIKAVLNSEQLKKYAPLFEGYKGFDFKALKLDIQLNPEDRRSKAEDICSKAKKAIKAIQQKENIPDRID